MVKKIVYDKVPICVSEILRYSGAKAFDDNINSLLQECIDKADLEIKYNVCYDYFDIAICDDVCDFGCFKICSKALAKNLNGCDRAIVFCATIGSGMDRLINKYGKLSPTKALLMQGIGAQRIEALCDCFCEDVAFKFDRKLKPRFSPGYGDLPLESQRDIFRVLDCAKQIGLCLNDSLIMSPSKSVSAIIGITNDKYEKTIYESKCKSCNKGDCDFRR